MVKGSMGFGWNFVHPFRKTIFLVLASGSAEITSFGRNIALLEVQRTFGEKVELFVLKI